MKRNLLFPGLIILVMAAGLQSQEFIKIDASFYSASLDEARMVDVYLPGDYYLNPEQEYAVIYYLHGGNGNQNSGHTDAMWYYNTHYGDTTLQSPPAIFVCPDGSCPPYMGSMWANSDLYGQFEDFLVQDVITFTEANFRAVPQKEFRFVTGWSMGGMGSANIAARHPDMFRGSIPAIAGIAMPDTCLEGWRSGCYEENGSYNLSYTGSGFMTQVMFTLCGAYSPNLGNPPYFVDIPFDTLGNWNDAILEKWYEFDASRRVKDLPDEDELAWFIICGTQDDLNGYPACLAFTDTLDAYGIAHDESYFEGGHVFDAASWMMACHWIDSIIAQSYLLSGLEIQVPGLPEFNVFPNPCREAFTVRLETSAFSDMDLELRDQSGQVVQRISKKFGQQGMSQQVFDVRGLPPGVYYCTLTSGGLITTKKVVKVN
jgi:S-formylglutathione hydrolase FrmB